MKMNTYAKRIILFLAISLTMILSCVILFACNIDNVKEISVTSDTINVRIGEFEYSNYTVTATYDSGKTEQFVLKEDMVEAKDRVKFFLEGEHEIAVSFMGKNTTLKVNVRRNVFDGVVFDDLDVVYNGEFYTVEVKNVPEGTIVTYPTTNRFRTAGQYQATAILRKDAYEMIELTANVNIRKADYDLSAVTFENKTEAYNGELHTLALEGTLPTGLYVDYTIAREGGREETGNSARNAGTYIVQAVFSGDNVNYNVVEPKQATLKIEQAVIDVSSLTFEDKTVTYDRTMQKIEVEGALPTGVSVVYLNNEHVDAGAYEATAIFSVDDTVNYAPIERKHATLTIQKADYDMSGINFNGTKVFYDGKEKTIELEGQLPNGLSVSYTGNVGVNAGSYLATATFSSNNVNYNSPEPMTATLIIDPAPARMDKITFERRRYLSREGDAYLDMDPYLGANAYRPENIPDGLTVSSVKYYKTDGWVDDLTDYNGVGDGYIEKITEDGYYVVVVNFDGDGNYTDISPAKTLIRTTTVSDFVLYNNYIYDADYVDPQTGNNTGMFYNYSFKVCSDPKSITVDEQIETYCDCNIFLEYSLHGDDAIVSNYDGYLPNVSNDEEYLSISDALQLITDKFFVFADDFVDNEFDAQTTKYSCSETFAGFIQAMNKLSPFDFYYDNDEPVFDIEKSVFFGMNEGMNYFMTNHAGDQTLQNYHAVLANYFGFANVEEFLEVVNELYAKLLANEAGASMDSCVSQLVYRGAIYEKKGDETLFILPYTLELIDAEYNFKTLSAYIFMWENSDGDRFVSALIDDADAFLDYYNNSKDTNYTIKHLRGRCELWELSLYKLIPVTVVVKEGDEDVVKTVTSGKDIQFIRGGEGIDKLIFEDREVYKFHTDLPGNCAETKEGYDEHDYTVSTSQANYKFCDCDPLGTVIKDGGDASNIAKRRDRADYAQMTLEIADKFDALSILYQEFISNYVVGDDVVNEWRIGVNNRNYNVYKAFFEFARDMFAASNRNMGKNNEYVLSESVIIGMNKAFSISINGSGYDYSIDQYRLMVAKLFGFSDIDKFGQYTDALASELVKNLKKANLDTVSARLVYDGAVFAYGDYFVIPYAIESDLSEQKVLAFVFVDSAGAMSIWLNDARNAFAAVNFGEQELEESAKHTVSINGRCLLFEDDGFIMKEDLDKEVVELIQGTQAIGPFDTDSIADAYVAIERLKNFAEVSSFLVYNRCSDEEGFEVYFDSVYWYLHSKTLFKGFYSLIDLSSADEVRRVNQEIIDEYVK